MNDDELNKKIAEKQTHCYTCGKKFGRVKYECPICYEFQCSEECRKKHIETMNRI